MVTIATPAFRKQSGAIAVTTLLVVLVSLCCSAVKAADQSSCLPGTYWDPAACCTGTLVDSSCACTDCLDCPTNTFSDAGAATCTPCAHGSASVAGSAACVCTAYWSGSDCSECAAPYYGADCNSTCDACVHGTCTSGTNGTCACAAAWTGDGCSSCTSTPDVASSVYIVTSTSNTTASAYSWNGVVVVSTGVGAEPVASDGTVTLARNSYNAAYAVHNSSGLAMDASPCFDGAFHVVVDQCINGTCGDGVVLSLQNMGNAVLGGIGPDLGFFGAEALNSSSARFVAVAVRLAAVNMVAVYTNPAVNVDTDAVASAPIAALAAGTDAGANHLYLWVSYDCTATEFAVYLVVQADDDSDPTRPATPTVTVVHNLFGTAATATDEYFVGLSAGVSSLSSRIAVTSAVWSACSAANFDAGACHAPICCPGGFAGSACTVCDAAHYGPVCASVCPDCGAHGQCDAGLDGTGECLCASGWLGTACAVAQVTCPATATATAAWPATDYYDDDDAGSVHARTGSVAGTCLGNATGTPTRNCTATGAWADPDTTCYAPCAAEVSSTASWPETEAGNYASGTCVFGGSAAPVRLCQGDGTWALASTADNVCAGTTARACNATSDDATHVNWPETVGGSTTTGVCASGYVYADDTVAPTRACSFDGVWGAPSGACIQLVASTCATPLVASISTAGTLVVVPTAAFTITAATTVASGCIDNTTTTTLVFTWSLVGVAPAWSPTTIIPSVASALLATTRSITLPASTLAPGTYAVDVTVQLVGADGSVLATATTSSGITVAAVAPAIVVRPSASAWLVSAHTEIVIDATGSYDPNPRTDGSAAAAVICTWTCSASALADDPAAVVPCSDLASSTMCNWTLPASAVSDDTIFAVSLTVTSVSTAMTSVSKLTITSVNGTVTTSVNVVAAKSLSTSSGPVVAQSEHVQLTAAVTFNDPTSRTSATTYAYTWSSVDSGIDVTSAAVAPAGTSGFNLILTAGALAAGATYTFRLDVATSLPTGVGSASYSFTVNTPPTGGSVVVNPPAGVFGSTSFTFTATGVTYNGVGSLQYNFYVTPPSGTEYALLVTPTYQSTVVVPTLPIGVNLVRAAAVDVLGDISYTAYTTVTITASDVRASTLTSLLASSTVSATTSSDVSGLVASVRTLAAALQEPETYGNLTAAEQTALRLGLVSGVATAVDLTTTVTASSASAMVHALNDIVGAPSNVDAPLFDALLGTVQTLAPQAGLAAGSFVSIVGSMLASQGVGTNAVAAIVATSLTDVGLSVLDTAVCGEAATAYEAHGLVLQASFKNSYAGVSTNVGDVNTVVYGSNFVADRDASAAGVIDDSSCRKAILSSRTTLPYIAPTDGYSTFDLASNNTYVTVSIHSSVGDAVNITGLEGTARTAMSFPVYNCNATNNAFTVTAAFWNETLGNWDTAGITRDDDAILASGDNCTFVGLTTHFTTFTITLQVHVVDPTRDAERLINVGSSRGAILTVTTLSILLAAYAVAVIFTVRLDARDAREERVPTPEQINNFTNAYVTLFGRLVPCEILETRRLDAWVTAYRINDQPALHKLSFWHRLNIHIRQSMRSSHAYICIFFRPLTPYSRTQRLTVTFSILLASMATNALFFQFGTTTSTSDLATLFIAGLLSSVVVFVPTTIVGILFRRIRRRDFVGKSFEHHKDADFLLLNIDDSKIERRNWFQRTFLDWHVPWWVNPVVFTVVGLGWLFSIYATLLYGVTFTDEQATAWLKSFAISVAASAVVLQTLKALIGGTVASTIGSLAVVSAVIAFSVSAVSIQ